MGRLTCLQESAESRLPSPGPRPEKVLTVSCRPDLYAKQLDASACGGLFSFVCSDLHPVFNRAGRFSLGEVKAIDRTELSVMHCQIATCEAKIPPPS